MVKDFWGVGSIKPIKIGGFGTSGPSSGSRKSCPKAVKETVWRKYNGNRMNGKCYVCKAAISFTSFEIGHNRAHSKGGKWTVSNCRSICRACNRSMGKMSIEAFKKKHFTKKKPTKKVTKKKSTKRKPSDPWGLGLRL